MFLKFIWVLIVFVQENNSWNSFVKYRNIYHPRFRLKSEFNDNEHKMTDINDSVMKQNITSTRFRGVPSQQSMLQEAQRLRQEAEELEVLYSTLDI